MTTFKAPPPSMSFNSDDFEYPPENDASKPVPNIDVVPPNGDSRYPSSSVDSGYGAPFGDTAMDPDYIDDPADDYDYPLIATQPQTQSQQQPYRPELEEDLVGCLIPATERCRQFNLVKTKAEGKWTIGRHPTNDLVLPGGRLSNFHCTLQWNGMKGRRSEVLLADSSSNGTWVNNVLVSRGETAILRSGASISLGGQPDMPNDWRFIFRDVEGQSTRHMNQIWAKYDVGHELGAGTFARVHKCIERVTGDEYAVKIIDRNKLRRSHTSEEMIVREISILKQLAEFRHKNIVSLREHFEEEDSIYLILELVKGGDLLTYIGAHGPIPEQQVRRMAAQICHAVAYIHSQGIAHRDLKPENVMVTETNPPDCKVADFGLAKLVGSGTFLKTMCGTPAYLAPEVMLRNSLQQGYDNRVDSWSLGVIFYCMLTNHAPFHEPFDPTVSASKQRQYFGTRQVDWSILRAANVSAEAYDFLRQLLAEDPRNRKEVHYMLDHRWISSLVPTDSQFQHPQSESSPTPPTVTDGALACSQSFENLNLSDITIPGLNTINGNAATDAAVDMSVDPEAAQVGIESFASEMSVTAKIPGAYPKPKKEKARQPLAAVDEASGENTSWDFVTNGSPRKSRGAVRRTNDPGPSRRTPSPAKVPAKRKSNLIEGSSPLSSLPDSGSEELRESAKKPLTRRAMPPRSKGKTVESPTPKRKLAHPPPAGARAKRASAAAQKNVAESSADEQPLSARRGSRRHAPAPKVPRHT